MELITVSQTIIGQGAVNAVNTRDLHSKLEVKTPYSMWIQRAIEKYGFEGGVDFTINKIVNGKNAQNDYIVSLDEDEKGIYKIDTLGGNQEMTALNESGLYSLIMTSRKQNHSQKWERQQCFY